MAVRRGCELIQKSDVLNLFGLGNFILSGKSKGIFKSGTLTSQNNLEYLIVEYLIVSDVLILVV